MISTKQNDARIVRRPGIVMACTAAVVLVCAMAAWSQTFYEASGKTAVFTLAPGAKVGPDAIRDRAVSRPGTGRALTMASGKGFIVVTLSSLRSGLGDIALYDIAGRQAYRQHGLTSASLRLDTRRFAPGMYTVVVRIDGQNYSRRFALSR
jgi:hypothetical protein